MGRIYYNNGLHYHLFYRDLPLIDLINLIHTKNIIELNERDPFETPLQVLVTNHITIKNDQLQILDDTIELIIELLLKGADPLIKNGSENHATTIIDDIEYYIQICRNNINEDNSDITNFNYSVQLQKLLSIINVWENIKLTI